MPKTINKIPHKIMMLSAIIVGCATKEEPTPEPEQQPAAVVVEPEQQPAAVVVQPKLSNPSDRPEWTRVVPDPENGYIFYACICLTRGRKCVI